MSEENVVDECKHIHKWKMIYEPSMHDVVNTAHFAKCENCILILDQLQIEKLLKTHPADIERIFVEQREHMINQNKAYNEKKINRITT